MKKKNTYMKFDEFKNTIASLSRSQGFYGRLLQSVNESLEYSGDEFIEQVNDMLANNKVISILDLVLWLES